MFDAEKIRDRFPAFREKRGGTPLIYFDNASTSQKPDCVIEAVASFYRRGCGNVHRGVHGLTSEATRVYEEARETVARFIGASDPSEIVFTRNATEAIHIAAYSWAWEAIGEGDEIVLSEMEHSSNLVPWQFLAKEKNARITFLRIGPDERLAPRDLEKKISPRTKLISLIHVSNSIGVVNRVDRFAEIARGRGIPILIDGAQSAPHIPVDVGAMGCDFFVFSGHKMLGPTGVGVLYGRSEMLEAARPFLGGGGTVVRADRAGATFNEAPWKLEAGTPSVADAVGLAEAIRFLEAIGMDEVRAHEERITARALERLSSIDRLTLYGPDRPENRTGVLSFNMEGIRPIDLARYLDKRGVAVRAGDHCTQLLLRSMGVAATARASFYLYNTVEEVDRFADLLEEASSLSPSAFA